MNWLRIPNKIIEYTFYLLFFLLPLIIIPYNYELFEFNKMLFVYASTVLITTGWLTKIILQKQINFKKNPLNLPVIIFLISQLISTFLSIDVHTSIWGYYSRFHGGLISSFCYVLLFWAFINNIKKPRRYIFLILASGFLVTLYGILEHFGIDAKYWVQDVRNRVFSTLGQPNWLGAWIDILIVLPIIYLLQGKTNLLKKIVLYSLLLIFYICLLFTGSRSAFIGFISTISSFLILLFVFQKKIFYKNFKKLVIVGLLLLFFCLFFGTPFSPSLPKLIIEGPEKPNPLVSNKPSTAPLLISSSWDIRKVVWKGAIDVWKHWPVFGSGVETFAYSYYNFRTREHNDLSEWDFLYNKAHNEYLNFLATTGIVGLGSYLILIIVTILLFLKIIKKSQKKLLLIGLFSGYVSILVTNFFGFSVVPVAFLFFLFPGIAICLSSEEKQESKVKILSELSVLQLIFLSLVFITSIYLFRSILELWQADFYFNRGKKYSEANYFSSGLNDLYKAINLSPKEALFHAELAETASRIAVVYSQTDSSESTKLTQEFTDLATNQIKTTLLLNSVHINFYKKAAGVFMYLGTIDPNYFQKATDILSYTTQIAPTDARTFYTLGLVYQTTNNFSRAAENYQKAIELRPHYTSARLKLAKIYLELKENQKAKKQLNYILEKIEPTNNEAVELLKKID